ncbi:toll-like receptor 13 isoform X1 [Anabas testudineus]|uniref:TIR domain-containing protein n=1 Tax=Anabas testudineus TaxID=64144 RepID=A0A3Q1IC03_ANATE|nr:toll-like receptor 13 isoform X1 [Anabas testudineus]XP_026205522.1 toll-like receptor 13 isoform X1 [Anabas testudineus]
MPPGGRSSLCFILRLLVLLPFLLQPSLAYSLKNCTIDYSDDPLDDVFVDCSSRELVTVPDDLPRHVTSVKLFHNLLKKIHRKDFGSLSKLRSLNLQDNYITHVDDGSFIHLGALTTLDIRSNRLTNLTANLFQGLSNLTVLVLSTNHIKVIHTSAFQFLSSLQTVMLGFNNLQQITDIQPILQLPHLQELSISYNLFTSFETKDLQLSKSSGLKVLDVSYNKLKKFSITTPIFPHLQSIDLSRCGQAGVLKWDIPDKSLLRNITHLYLGHTLIPYDEIQQVQQSLDSLMHLRLGYKKLINKRLLDTFCKIPTLRKLDLSSNKVASKKLVSCSQLSELDLSDTHMTELPKGSIRSMKRLRSLNVEHNFYHNVPHDVRSLSSLEILNLNDNLISELSCDDFINTTRLIELHLKTNRIAKLVKCVFEKLNELKVLDLSHNMLQTFGNSFKTGALKLEFLDLSENSVQHLEKGDFQGLISLKYLNVVSDDIDNTAFKGLNNLETLVIHVPLSFKYNFTDLPKLENLIIYLSNVSSLKSLNTNSVEAFFNLKSLKSFTMICSGHLCGFDCDKLTQTLRGMNHLEDFTADNIYNSAAQVGTLRFNVHLKRLTIRQTDLSELDPELFHPIPNLEVLDFSSCKLKSLDFLVKARPPALRFLNLSNNELTVINETVFQSLPALTYLDLDNNPFTCDCSNAGFIQWVIGNNQTQVVNAHQYTCSSPGAEQGRKLLDFDVQSCWMDVGFLCFISSTCLVVLTLLSSFIYHFLRWQLSYGFYLFLAFIYDSRKKKKGTPHQFDAFVSYNVHDEAWVYREMLPVLEEEQGWRLCLHHRDFQPGEPMENITDTIYSSRKTICVISQHFLQSEWCSREIQMASFHLFDEQKDVLILLFLEEIPDQQMSPYYRMRKLVKRRTYLSWPQAGQHTGVFWQNVRRALETGDDPTDNNLLTGPAQC